MLPLMHPNVHVPPQAFSMLEDFLTEPFPHTPQDMMQLVTLQRHLDLTE